MTEHLPHDPFPSMDQLTRELAETWWRCKPSLPPLGPRYPRREQAKREAHLSRFVDEAIGYLRRTPSSQAERDALQNRLAEGFADLGRQTLEMTEAQISSLLGSGMLEIGPAFCRAARAFDPHIGGAEIYQALRNVWAMNGLQALAGLPVALTPSVFAYSMLYPYTDNYLDDPAIAPEEKRGLNRRLALRLQGQAVAPANDHEARIYALVGLIEGEHERAARPQVYESLLAIHRAQEKSLRLLDPAAAPYEVDVLGIALEKGGASVVADGYLVAGALTPEQARFLYGWGAILQLVDDLQDVEQDRRAGLLTIFSQAAGRWPLERLTNRTLHLVAQVMAGLDAFPAPDAAPLKELMAASAVRLLLNAVGAARRRYSRRYLLTLQAHAPFRYAALRRVQRRLARERLSLARMVEHYADAPGPLPPFLAEPALPREAQASRA